MKNLLDISLKKKMMQIPFCLRERKVEDEWSDVSVNEELETLGDRELNDLQLKPSSSEGEGT